MNKKQKVNYNSTPRDLTPLQKELESLSIQFDKKNDLKEKIYKYARDVVAESKKLIFGLHRISKFNKEETLLKFEEGLKKINEKIELVQKELDEHENYFWMFRYSFSFSIEEFIEGVAFYYYLKHQKLITKRELQELTKITVTTEDYLLGILDTTGELMRYSVNSVGNGDKEVPFEVMNFLQKTYIEFLRLPNQKEDKMKVMKQSLEKCERLCYEIVLKPKSLNIIDFEEEPQQ